ncbi:hypothetical protein AJ80_04070 [Polytolypa hystricis UAMH7299]|uniref:Phosphoglucomutase n=1 Tax=Polytolypa hystricis (strain UAMH7299) TaxID=1447883 RepID=A0A2B7YFD7_POLH7|nr:hypothetical protein AJ80_04070 [Polytolypa hystricis UAMH7299]
MGDVGDSSLLPQETLSALVQRWLDWDRDPETREEIIQLRDANNEAELEKRLRHRIQFGTAGLRGRMQAGFSSMNSLTVIQASQGLARFIKSTYRGRKEPAAVIGRDGRHNSAKFASLTANAFKAEGFEVLFNDMCPTPLVPYRILADDAIVGVMITASHNPAADNGIYSVSIYLANGAQINSPIDAQIADSIQQSLEPWSTAWDGIGEPKCPAPSEVKFPMESYFNAVHKFLVSIQAGSQPIPFVYTPLHGVGYSMMDYFCKELRLTGIVTVSEQRDPDPDFSTVKFPNPEEAGALDLAMKTADSKSIDLIIANDPDADRFAVAQKVDGMWFKFTGDQVGVLLASYILKYLPKSTKELAMLSTAVSTGMLARMAEVEKFHFQETLTGFKWLGNVARDLECKGYTVPFAFEEALGYMFTPVCYDKDGLTAAMVFLAAKSSWWMEGLTPYAKLQQLYEKYGYHENLNTYFVSPDVSTTTRLFEAIRSQPEEKREAVGPFPISRWRDMTKGFDSGTPDNVPLLPADKTSQMITVWSERGNIRFTLRGSGTEPKVKLYIESCSESKDEAIKSVCEVFSAVLESWIRPSAPGMTFASKMTTSSGYTLAL